MFEEKLEKTILNLKNVVWHEYVEMPYESINEIIQRVVETRNKKEFIQRLIFYHVTKNSVISIKEIISFLEKTKFFLLEKNKSYGDAALNPQKYFSNLEAKERLMVRIDDKINRLLLGKEYQGDDTVLDLIGYFIILDIVEPYI